MHGSHPRGRLNTLRILICTSLEVEWWLEPTYPLLEAKFMDKSQWPLWPIPSSKLITAENCPSPSYATIREFNANVTLTQIKKCDNIKVQTQMYSSNTIIPPSTSTEQQNGYAVTKMTKPHGKQLMN
jgi:hypothetical protein